MKKQTDQIPAAPKQETSSDPSTRAALAEQIAVLEQTVRDHEAALRQAETKIGIKGQQLATVSHEIRTPMGAIMNLAELLADTDLDDLQRHYAETLKSSAIGLLNVLNAALDHAKLETGNLELNRNNFNPRKVLDAALETQIMRCVQKGLELRLEVAKDLPEQLYGDPVRIRQVLTNLVDNAVKFTDEGRVDLLLTAKEQNKGHWVLHFEVKDTGIGLSEQAMDQVFAPYIQADEQISTHFGGTGLGLSISQQLVRVMGGDLGVESELGLGSKFWFNVKCEARRDKEDTVDHSENDYRELMARNLPRTGSVLIVEDNRINQMLISTFLDKFGHTSEIADSGAKALKAVQQRDFDVILMDIKMPGMDGMETTRQIRRGKGNARTVPIIALTANALNGDKENYLDAGMDAYLTKPIIAAELYRVIDRFLTCDQRLAS